MKNKIAIIDMGTNTFHLLIAESEGEAFNITLRDRLAVKIGMGGINDGIITEDGIQRALVAMRSFKNTIEENEVGNVYAFGTSALRNARNREEVKLRIKDVTGIEINIISGEDEARFIYFGVKAALGLGNDRNLIVDIGGGSVEFIIADQDRIFWMESFEIGAQRLLERFQKNDPILDSEIKALDEYFSSSLIRLSEAINEFKPTVLVGSSGTFDTLSDIFCEKHNIYKSAEEVETPLSVQGFYHIYHDLIQKDRTQRMQIPGMIEMRVDMIVVACCLVRFLLDKFSFPRIRVSTYSLKEGVLAYFNSPESKNSVR
jgi:exopolyphosphatase / guanosine-5'-triphosphate,3'-diphosphate pyrophosphatase